MTRKLLERLAGNPGKVQRYTVNGLFGKPKSTKPFPLPERVMRDFVECFNVACQTIHLYPKEALRAIDFNRWTYVPGQTLLDFFATHCKGADNTQLAKAVLTAAATLLQHYPCSLLHEFFLLHEIRYALNFDKNENKKNREALINQEKNVLEKIKMVYTLLNQKNIQYALQVVKGNLDSSADITVEHWSGSLSNPGLTFLIDQGSEDDKLLKACKYALLMLECYRIPYPDKPNNTIFYDILNVAAFGNTISSSVVADDGVLNFASQASGDTWQYVQLPEFKSSTIASFLLFKKSFLVWINSFANQDLVAKFVGYLCGTPSEAMQNSLENIQRWGRILSDELGSKNYRVIYNFLKEENALSNLPQPSATEEASDVAALATEGEVASDAVTAASALQIKSFALELKDAQLPVPPKKIVKPFGMTPISEGKYEDRSNPNSVQQSSRQERPARTEGNNDGVARQIDFDSAATTLYTTLAETSVLPEQSQSVDDQDDDNRSVCSERSAASGASHSSAWSARSRRGDIPLECRGFDPNIKRSFDEAISLTDEESVAYVLRHADYAFKYAERFGGYDTLKAKLWTFFPLASVTTSGVVSGSALHGSYDPQAASLHAQTMLKNIRPSSKEFSLFNKSKSPFAPFAFAYYCEYLYTEKMQKNIRLEEYEFNFLLQNFKYLYRYQELLDTVSITNSFSGSYEQLGSYIISLTMSMIAERWQKKLETLESDQKTTSNTVMTHRAYLPHRENMVGGKEKRIPLGEPYEGMIVLLIDKLNARVQASAASRKR